MLMELVQGGELFGLLHNMGGYIDSGSAQFYAGCVITALQSLHDNLIAYRDLKPENVLLDEDYNPKICDFGVARLMKDGGHQFTMTGQIGTPIYMAPEIIVGNRNRYGRGADVYSFGILLWAMWHRNIPYKNLILTENLDAFQLAQRVSRGIRDAARATAAARALCREEQRLVL